MLGPSPCGARKPTLLQVARVRIGVRPTKVERSLEIKRVHAIDVQIVVLACAFKQIDNRAALLRSISNSCGPSRQLEWVSRYGSDLSYSLCIDGTTYEGTEDHKGSEERGPHSEHPL